MTEYLTRAASLEGFDQLVTQLGGEPAQLRIAVGLSMDLADPDQRVSYRAFLQLLELAAAELACPHFGLLLSRYQGIGMLGVVGFIMREAPDVRTALMELKKYLVHHVQGATIILKVEGDTAILGFEGKLPGVAMHQQYELATGIGNNILQWLCGPGWRARGVYLPYAAPRDTRPYEKQFRCPVYFDREACFTTFDASDLDRQLDRADKQLHRILEQHMALVKLDFPDDLLGQIKHLIKQALMTGDCSIERVAAYVSVNKRTLQRQLKAAGASYQLLLEEVRFDIAARYLTESSSSMTTLADMLCYSELSAFSNAFKQHFGQSPRAWKQQRVKP